MTSHPLIRLRFLIRLLILLSIAFSIILWENTLTIGFLPLRKQEVDQYPLLKELVKSYKGANAGGAWILPPNYLPSNSTSQIHTILDAARLASQVAKSDPNRKLQDSEIPLIIHQVNFSPGIIGDLDNWSEVCRTSVERWLQYAHDGGLPYFMWDDTGFDQIIHEYETVDGKWLGALPTVNEKGDLGQILILKNIGGFYADLDAYPLKPPWEWITTSEFQPWTDTVTDTLHKSDASIQLIAGIESDCPSDSDAYWRMGYSYPIKLTQWALASSPRHPVLLRYIDTLVEILKEIAKATGDDIESPMFEREVFRVDPLELTGPAALTASVQSWLKDTAGLRWNALSGLEDGGRTKLVSDVLILPITWFSPGRGSYGNMDFRSITDSDAKIWHRSQSSWRKITFRVEFGKFCRTVFRRCKTWPKWYGAL